MSNTIKGYLQSNPIIARYVQNGLININSLARFIKKNNLYSQGDNSVAAIGMDIRRRMKQLPDMEQPTFDSTEQKLHVVVRTNIEELIFNKNEKNRQTCLNIFHQISQSKHFSCLVEGEREIVLLTDYSLDILIKKERLKKIITLHTNGLGFISIDFPITLRKVAGIYSQVTSALFLSHISIHSFHTIGGEILILVKNEDLLKAQEILTSFITGVTI